jgi:L-aminopeptidase/D-esterase-like protein
LFDGDVVFALSLAPDEERKLDVNIAGSYAARLVEEAIVHGVCAANKLPFEGYAAHTQPY